jgi:CMP-N-acetylneuraminic acid synthetase
LWCFLLEGETMRPFIDDRGLESRSQDLPPAYAINGAFYMVEPQHLRERRSFYGADMVPLIMDATGEDLDIDTEWDWRLVEVALSEHSEQSRALRQNVANGENP